MLGHVFYCFHVGIFSTKCLNIKNIPKLIFDLSVEFFQCKPQILFSRVRRYWTWKRLQTGLLYPIHYKRKNNISHIYYICTSGYNKSCLKLSYFNCKTRYNLFLCFVVHFQLTLITSFSVLLCQIKQIYLTIILYSIYINAFFPDYGAKKAKSLQNCFLLTVFLEFSRRNWFEEFTSIAKMFFTIFCFWELVESWAKEIHFFKGALKGQKTVSKTRQFCQKPEKFLRSHQ